jgi:cell division protein FtsI (penicillin-binding protein 3)
VAFFGGFAPSDSPAIVILVALDEPQGKSYGGIVAAPVFSDVGSWTLNHLNVTPSLLRHVSCPVEKDEEIVVLNPDLPGTMPDVRGLAMREVLRKTKRLGLKVIVKGSGLAVEQSPAPGTPLRKRRLLTVTFRPPC